MKKLFILATAIAIAFGCKKPLEDLQPLNPTPTPHPRMTIVKDASRPDQTLQVPLLRVTNSATVDVGSVDGGVLLGGRFKFNAFGSFIASRDVKNFFYRIKDGATVIDSSSKFSTVSDGFNSFAQSAKQLVKTKVYTFEFIYDVAVTATDGVGLDDGCSLDVTFYYSQKTSPYDTLGPVTLQKNTFVLTPASSLETSLNSATPVSQRTTGGTEAHLLTFDVTSMGGANIMLEQGYRFENILTPTVTDVRVYLVGGALVGTGTISGQTAVVTFNTVVPENTTLTYSMWVPVGTITSSFSGTNLKAALDYVKYRSADGTVKTNHADRVSNNIFAYKSTLSLTYNPLSGSIVDSVVMNAYQWMETASSAGSMAKKQNTFAIVFADNGFDDSLKLYPQMFEGTTDITSLGYFSNQNGDTVKFLKEGDSKLFFTLITGMGERIIPAGGSKTYTLKIRPVGFKHSGDGDGYSVQLLIDQFPTPFNFKFLNKGISGFDAKISDVASSNGQAQSQNLVISDMSAGSSHSGLYFITSNDWGGGYLVAGVPDGQPGLPVKPWTQ